MKGASQLQFRPAMVFSIDPCSYTIEPQLMYQFTPTLAKAVLVIQQGHIYTGVDLIEERKGTTFSWCLAISKLFLFEAGVWFYCTVRYPVPTDTDLVKCS